MKNNLIRFALAASLLLNLTMLATAGYRYYSHARSWVSPFGKVMDRDKFLFEELSLKPEQSAILKEKAVPFRAEIDNRRKEIAAKRKELVVLLRQSKPDTRAIDAVIREISGKQEAMQRMVAGHMLEMKTSLDPGQQERLFDLIENSMAGSGQASCPPGQGRM